MARRHSEHVVDGETRRGKLLACKRDLRSTGRIPANFAVLLDAWDFVRSVLLHWSEMDPTTITVLCDLASSCGRLERQSGECGDKRLFQR